MALLGLIPKQGFEIVRDIIGAILLVEIDNQHHLSSAEEDFEVFSERITPMDDADDVYINIILDSANYAAKNQKDTQGRTMYFIDVYTRGVSDGEGTSNATILLHKYIGWIRYILCATAYNTLDLPLGLIGGTEIESFATLDPALKEDSQYTRFARLQFAVRIQENQQLWQGVTLESLDTNVKLDLTEKGYKYILEN